MDEVETRVVHLLLCLSRLSRDTATVLVQRGEQGALLLGERDGDGWKEERSVPLACFLSLGTSKVVFKGALVPCPPPALALAQP